MKKYLPLIALFGSSACLAFPTYNSVSCNGSVEGHNIYVEYNKKSQNMIVGLDGELGALHATESGNKIRSNPIRDEDGSMLVFELSSSNTNWNATLNLYENNLPVFSMPVHCQRLGITFNAMQQQAPVRGILSKLKRAK